MSYIVEYSSVADDLLMPCIELSNRYLSVLIYSLLRHSLRAVRSRSSKCLVSISILLFVPKLRLACCSVRALYVRSHQATKSSDCHLAHWHWAMLMVG
jgi:hypothetical protein